jgi:RNA polymerase sigma factor (TIGR02999 family)
MDDAQLRALFSVAYEELRRVAARVCRKNSKHTLNPTALVNEAFVKLSASQGITPDSALHFKHLVARAMRQVLIEGARRRGANKRGSDYEFVAFDEELSIPDGDDPIDSDRLLTLNDILEELECMSPRQAQLVECRFFGGLEFADIAQLQGVSRATVMRDWRVAKAWLALQLRQAG